MIQQVHKCTLQRQCYATTIAQMHPTTVSQANEAIQASYMRMQANASATRLQTAKPNLHRQSPMSSQPSTPPKHHTTPNTFHSPPGLLPLTKQSTHPTEQRPQPNNNNQTSQPLTFTPNKADLYPTNSHLTQRATLDPEFLETYHLDPTNFINWLSSPWTPLLPTLTYTLSIGDTSREDVPRYQHAIAQTQSHFATQLNIKNTYCDQTNIFSLLFESKYKNTHKKIM